MPKIYAVIIVGKPCAMNNNSGMAIAVHRALEPNKRQRGMING